MPSHHSTRWRIIHASESTDDEVHMAIFINLQLNRLEIILLSRVWRKIRLIHLMRILIVDVSRLFGISHGR